MIIFLSGRIGVGMSLSLSLNCELESYYFINWCLLICEVSFLGFIIWLEFCMLFFDLGLNLFFIKCLG